MAVEGNRVVEKKGTNPPARPGGARREDYSLAERFSYRVKRAAKDLRFALNHALLKNPGSRRRFAAQGVVLSEAQKRVVSEIREQGYSLIHIDELTGDAGCWERLAACGEAFVKSEKVQRGIEKYRSGVGEGQWKEYIVRLFTRGDEMSVDHPLLSAALEPRILDTVNSAFGMWTKLLGATIWYTISTEQKRDAMASQNWHRDPEDRQPIKLFLYFNEVDESNGATEYVPESRAGGKYAHLWPLATGCGTRGYIPEETIEREVNAQDIVTAKGGPGTLVFLDTSGFHRGGMACERERVMANWVFVSPASLYERIFEVEGGVGDGGDEGLSGAADFAVR